MRRPSGFEAVLLAAGASERMGRPKALIEWGGLPLVAFQAREFLSTRIDRLVLVLGARAGEVEEALRAALADYPGPAGEERLAVVVNRDWKLGKCGSIRIGAGALSAGARHIVLHSVDQPAAGEALEAIFGFHLALGGLATVPVVRGKKGHPVVLASCLRDRLSHLSEEELGLKGLVRSVELEGSLRFAPVAAPCVAWDINRPEDLAALKRVARREEGLRPAQAKLYDVGSSIPDHSNRFGGVFH